MVDFAENPDAFCFLAKSMSDRREGLAMLTGPLRDGSWKVSSEKFVHHLSWYRFWEEAFKEANELRQELLATIVRGSLDDGAHAALPGIFNTWSFAPFSGVPETVTWVLGQVGPNDGAMVADLVGHVLDARNEQLTRDSFALIEWLLTNGSSELRSGRRSRLVVDLVGAVLAFGSFEFLEPSVRFALFNQVRIGSDGWGHRTLEQLAPAVEQVVGRSGSTALIGDLVEALEPKILLDYVHGSLHAWRECPVSRIDLLQRLARGQVTSVDDTGLWGSAFLGPPVELVFADAAIARRAVDALTRRMIAPTTFPNSWQEARGDWGRVLARGFIHATQLLKLRAHEDIDLLQRAAGQDPVVTEGVFQGTRAALIESDDQTLTSLRQVLEAPGVEPTVVVAALELLRSTNPSKPSESFEVETLEHVTDAILEVLCAEVGLIQGFGLANCFAGVTRVRADLLDDAKPFVREGDTLVVSRRDLESVCEVSAEPPVQQLLAALYVVHEAVHLFQKVAGMQAVERLRFAGAEIALLHLDLGADHVAARVVHAAFPNWDLLWIKDWQARSLVAFPAVRRNPPYSRIRKALRLVALRVDWLLRKHAIGLEHLGDGNYGFADFAPAGGSFIAMVNRPPFVVVKTSALSSVEASVLFRAIESEPRAIERVDEIVERALVSG